MQNRNQCAVDGLVDASQPELDPCSQCSKRYGHYQARGCSGQGFVNTATELGGIGTAFGSSHGAEGLHHAQYGSQQAEKRGQGCDDFDDLQRCLERLQGMLGIPCGGFPDLPVVLIVLNGLYRIGDKMLQRIHPPPAACLMSHF